MHKYTITEMPTWILSHPGSKLLWQERVCTLPKLFPKTTHQETTISSRRKTDSAFHSLRSTGTRTESLLVAWKPRDDPTLWDFSPAPLSCFLHPYSLPGSDRQPSWDEKPCQKKKRRRKMEEEVRTVLIEMNWGQSEEQRLIPQRRGFPTNLGITAQNAVSKLPHWGPDGRQFLSHLFLHRGPDGRQSLSHLPLRKGPDCRQSLPHTLNYAVDRQKQLWMALQQAQLCFSRTLFMGSEICIS